MNTLELFEFPNFKGVSECITLNNPNLSSIGFLKKAQSLKVKGDPWIVFSEVNYGYKGDFRCYLEGSYNTIPAWDQRISSVKLVKGGLYHHKITLFEHIHYGGQPLTLEKEAKSLKSYGFDNKVSSHKVASGAWILYSGEFFEGNRMVAVIGDEVDNYVPMGWNDKVNSLRPVLPGEFTD
ncbi:epidermal differentiation-specific protein-like [Gastrophryne carolinensis]